jgi:tetratricopeptide (TPR) repeat protein
LTKIARPRRGAGGHPSPPPNADALLDAAAAHYLAGRLDEAASLYGRAESRDDFRAGYSLAVIDIRRGRFEAARVRLLAVTATAPDDFAAWHNLGVALQALGRWRQAAKAYGRAHSLRPDATETGFSLAIVLATEGRVDEAIDVYRSLAADPAPRGRALIRLAILRPGAVTEVELDTLRGEAARASGESAIAAQFALGGALEARGEYDAAFAAFETGAALKRAALEAGEPASRPAAVEKAHERSANHIQSLFTPQFLAGHAGEGEKRAAPIFIVGFPRCGSTLVEQILASHPGVHGLGENPALSSALGSGFPYDQSAAMEPDPFRRLAERYLANLARLGWKSRLRPVDKTLENYLHVGAIALMFPRAVIIHCLREPLDSCLSCFGQLFASGAETLYDLGQIGREYARYRRLMDHWRAVLPGRVKTVNYEALVTDPEVRIRQLVTETCGLDWAEECVRFFETRRPVATASADQARRPIYRSSLERWRRYEPHLAPLIAALGSYAPKAG